MFRTYRCIPGTATRSLPNLGSHYELLARTLRATSSILGALSLKDRATRLFAYSGNVAGGLICALNCTRFEPGHDQEYTRALASPAGDLDTAVALLELAGHPHVLGRERLPCSEPPAAPTRRPS